MFMVITYKYPPLQVLEFYMQIEKHFMHHKKKSLQQIYIEQWFIHRNRIDIPCTDI